MVILSSVRIYQGIYSINILPIVSVHNNSSTILSLLLGLILSYFFWKKLKN